MMAGLVLSEVTLKRLEGADLRNTTPVSHDADPSVGTVDLDFADRESHEAVFVDELHVLPNRELDDRAVDG